MVVLRDGHALSEMSSRVATTTLVGVAAGLALGVTLGLAGCGSVGNRYFHAVNQQMAYRRYATLSANSQMITLAHHEVRVLC